MSRKSFSLLIGLAFFLTTSSTAFASGFAIVEQSVSGLGTAFSSGAAANDASTVFFNPAGMLLLEGQQVTAGVHFIFPSAKFKKEKGENFMGAPLSGSDGGNGGETAVVPNFFYTNKLSDKVAIGLGITAPFGLRTDYNKTWVGRYHAVESDVKTININPAVAFKITNEITVAAGVSAEYMDVTLSSMIDGGLVYYGATGNPSYISNSDFDVFAENKADDWGFGFNLGAIYEFSPDTRMGFAYRSEITHKLRGDIKTDVPSTLAPLDFLFQKQDIHGKITLPATASFNVYSKITDRFALMADVTWTEWSSFDELTIYFEGDGIAGNDSTTTTEKWNDTMRYSLGATFQATDALVLRSGVAYDETPIPDKYRTPRIPGEDRYWVTLGAGYQLTESLSMDVAYAHLFVDDSKMEKYAGTDPEGEDFARGTVVGEFDNSVDIASVQFSYKF